ncbi:hypothetical protein KR222_009820 [Zaprionus bogoriensis]|nr:hypothetical protein KR222_009820 [Zaprionus bogoriensis]
MARFQLISSLLLLAAILVAQTTAEAPRRRFRLSRQRQAFARQEVVPPTPYPSAAELKPEEPALIYGPPPSTDVNELPTEEEPAVNSFQPDADVDAPVDVDAPIDGEELETDESSLEVTTPAAPVPARLRSSRQRLAKLQLKQTNQTKRQRIARLEQLPAEVPAVAPAVAPAPQFYYINAQQPYVVALNAAPQQLNW